MKRLTSKVLLDSAARELKGNMSIDDILSQDAEFFSKVYTAETIGEEITGDRAIVKIKEAERGWKEGIFLKENGSWIFAGFGGGGL